MKLSIAAAEVIFMYADYNNKTKCWGYEFTECINVTLTKWNKPPPNLPIVPKLAYLSLPTVGTRA